MIVVDTSIVYKWLAEEADSHISIKILTDYLNNKQEIIIPDILQYELSNVLAFKKELNPKEANEVWNLFSDFQLRVFIPDLKFLAECIKFAKQNNVSVYDTTFAILAQKNNCNFYTADKRFVDQVNLPFVKYLSDYTYL